MAREKRTLQEAFEKYVNTTDPDECWEWNGKYNTVQDCPVLWHGNRLYQAVRVAWELFVGPLHRSIVLTNGACGNKRCVKPQHTTQKKVGAPTGERNNQSQLSANQVLVMRHIYNEGKHSYKSLGELFGVSPRHVSRIVNLQAWVDLKPPSTGSIYLLRLLLALPLYPSLALKLFPKMKKRGIE